MIYDPAPLAIFIFLGFVFGTVGLSFYLGRKAKSSRRILRSTWTNSMGRQWDRLRR